MLSSLTLISATFSFGSFLSYTLMDVGIQYLLKDFGLFQVMFLNNLFSILFMVLALTTLKRFIKPNAQIHNLVKAWKPKRWSLHLILGVIALVGDILVFYGLKFHSLAEIYTIILTAPIFSALLAFLFYREKISGLKWSCILISFCASIWALNPSFSGISLLLVGVLTTSILYATWYFVVKYHAQEEGIIAIFTSSRIFSLVLLLVPTILYWKDMGQSDFWIIVWCGFGYFTGYMLIILATRFGNISTVASMQYSQLPLGLLADFLLYSIYPSIVSICAGALIVGGGLLIVYNDRREELRMERGIARLHG